MPAINHTAFPGKVMIGEKRCTIWATRKTPIKVGDVLYHYSGMRTKNCRLLMTVPCKRVRDIFIIPPVNKVLIDGARLRIAEVVALAAADGFEKTADFFAYFAKAAQGRDFLGQIIEWDPRDAIRPESEGGPF